MATPKELRDYLELADQVPASASKEGVVNAESSMSSRRHWEVALLSRIFEPERDAR